MTYRCEIFTFTHPYVPYIPYAMVLSSLDDDRLNVSQMTFWATVQVAERWTRDLLVIGSSQVRTPVGVTNRKMFINYSVLFSGN